MPRYDGENADPPAPVAQVVLRNPATGAQSSPVGMLIDTGADITLIPALAAAQIGCRPVSTQTLSGFDGSSAKVYEEVAVEMIFLGKSFKGQFLTIEQPTGIIGRNVLNYLVLTFDGPRLVWEETKRD